MMKLKKAILLLFPLMVMLWLFPTMAHADLGITPVRVVFQGRDRSAIVQLVNLTDRTNSYRMGWLQMKMEPSGKYIPVFVKDEKDPHSVSNMVLFSPRQVTIGPHGQQTIRLSLRRPADLPPGEYRAHMSIVRMAQQGPKRTENPDDKEFSVALDVNIGFSIPVIIRNGDDPDLKVSLSSPQLGLRGTGEAAIPELKINLNRDSGKFSTYGFFQVFWKSSAGKEKEIGKLDNVALYPELTKREISIPLSENPTNGSMRVVYMGKYESDGVKWAEQTFPIGK